MTKILVIEDERLVRESIEELLTLKGHKVITAENGKLGLEKALQVEPDLILCDVNMPEMDGFETVKRIRGHKSAATIPYIFLTARTAVEDFREGMRSGADDYLLKPFEPEELFEAINRQFMKQELLKEEHEALSRQKIRDAIEEFKEKSDTENKDLKKALIGNLEEILFSISHQMRSPLATILGLVEAMDADSLSEEDIKKYAEMFKNVAGQMEKNTVELNRTFSDRKSKLSD